MFIGGCSTEKLVIASILDESTQMPSEEIICLTNTIDSLQNLNLFSLSFKPLTLTLSQTLILLWILKQCSSKLHWYSVDHKVDHLKRNLPMVVPKAKN